MGTATRGLMRALACLLLMPALAFAQTEAGKIIGTVTDPSGAMLPGVDVTLVTVERATTRTTVTNAAGVYVFAGLVPGVYEVTAELSGFGPGKLQVTVWVGATVAGDLTLALASQSETVTVTAGVPGSLQSLPRRRVGRPRPAAPRRRERHLAAAARGRGSERHAARRLVAQLDPGRAERPALHDLRLHERLRGLHAAARGGAAGGVHGDADSRRRLS